MVRNSNLFSDSIVFMKKAYANLQGRYITPGISSQE